MKYLLLILTLIPTISNAGPLEEALTIVLAQSEVVQSRQRMTGIVGNSSNFSAKIRLSSGFSDKANDEFSPGFQNRVGIVGEYPIMGGVSQTDKDKAQALSALYESKDNVTRSFILELQKLAVMKNGFDLSNRNHDFVQDLLLKIEQANDLADKQGKPQNKVDKTSALDKVLTAEAETRRAYTQYTTMRHSVSRIYGKTDWEKLTVHIRAYLNIIAPTPPPIIEKKKKP